MTALVILVLLFVLNIANIYPVVKHWSYTNSRILTIAETCITGINLVLCSLFAWFYYSGAAPLLSGVAAVISVLFFLSASLVGLSGIRLNKDASKMPNIVGIVGNIAQVILIIIFCSVCM
jgi:hypothetical protein